MVWFKRKDKKVITETKDKKEIPEGLWYKCPKCKVVVSSDEHHNNLWVCSNCNHHERINSKEYFFPNLETYELISIIGIQDCVCSRTIVPPRFRVSTNPSRASERIALLIVGLEVLNFAVSCSSVGSLSPGLRSPFEIDCCMVSRIVSNKVAFFAVGIVAITVSP